MRSGLWSALVLLLCVLGNATEPLYAPVATVGPTTDFRTSLFGNDIAEEDELPGSILFPNCWSFKQLLTPRLPRSWHDPKADSSLFSPLHAAGLLNTPPEFRRQDGSLRIIP